MGGPLDLFFEIDSIWSAIGGSYDRSPHIIDSVSLSVFLLLVSTRVSHPGPTRSYPSRDLGISAVRVLSATLEQSDRRHIEREFSSGLTASLSLLSLQSTPLVEYV